MSITELEDQIIKKVISDALASGYTLSVWDGEEETVTNSSDADKVFEALKSTDQDHLYFLKDGKSVGWVFFIYGECGWDVINDHTTSLEEALKGTNELVDQLCDASQKAIACG